MCCGRAFHARAQPLRMTDHRESNDAWMVPVGLASRRNGDVDMCHGLTLDTGQSRPELKTVNK